MLSDTIFPQMGPTFGTKPVAKLHVVDEANLFRVEIEGRFAGEAVDRVRQHWEAVLQEGSVRRFTVDISQLTGYDTAGSRLLRQMYRHGVHISARTPRSLVFLNEIAAPSVSGPTLVYKAPQRQVEIEPKRSETVAPAKPMVRAAAAARK
jgi:hypothetical protein